MKTRNHVIFGAFIWLIAASVLQAEEPSVWQSYLGNTLYDMDGKEVSLESLEGKYVGLYFSASWCGPCRKFTPLLAQWHDKFNDNFEVILIGSDQNEKSHFKYMKKYKMPWYTIPLNGKEAKALDRQFQVSAIPTLVLIDPDGKIITTKGRDALYHHGALLKAEGSRLATSVESYNCGSCSKQHKLLKLEATSI